MELIFEVLLETAWGAIILGVLLFIALIINFWNDKTPKI